MLLIKFPIYLRENWKLVLATILISMIVIKYMDEIQIMINKISNILHYDPKAKSPMELQTEQITRDGVEEVRKILKEQQEEREKNDRLTIKIIGAAFIGVLIYAIIKCRE